MSIREAALVMRDGTLFEGELIGADPPDGIATGEVVFNTVSYTHLTLPTIYSV